MNNCTNHYNTPLLRRFCILLYSCLLIHSAFAQRSQDKLHIETLTGDFYIYTTYNSYEGYSTPAHGMYLVTTEGVVMFDTPWDSTQCKPLLDSIWQRHQKKLIMAFATHWHSDKTNGLAHYRNMGIRTYTTILTDELSKKNNKNRAEFLMMKDTVFNIGGYTFKTYYPGEGHTVDNIIIWFPKEKVLYGGCLIKGASDKNLGYLDDGNKATYTATLKNVKRRCKSPRYIIVSHSDWRSKKSLKHSIYLAKQLKTDENQ